MQPSATQPPKVSIIVPVYNTAPYLAECLDSILAQTEASWECLAVDDGSTDGSAQILDDYADRDARFRVTHQQNAGPSVARNAALDMARGEWIAMLDSDDTWAPELLEKVLACADSFGVDMVQVGIQPHRGGVLEPAMLPLGKEGVHVQAIDKSYLRRSTSYSCDKVILRKLIERYHVRYETDLKYSEDLPIVIQYCAATDRVGLVGEPLYRLRLHETSATARFRTGAHPVSYYRNMLDSVVRSAEALVTGGFPSSRVAVLYPALLSWLRGRVEETRTSMPADMALDVSAHAKRLQWALFRLAPWRCKLRAFSAACRKL